MRSSYRTAVHPYTRRGRRHRAAEPVDVTHLRLSEVLGALSHALDVTEGMPAGHAERSCLIGMRLAEHLELDVATRSSLFYALLLKDAGCSSNASKVAALYGSDDACVKRDRKTLDHLNAGASV